MRRAAGQREHGTAICAVAAGFCRIPNRRHGQRAAQRQRHPADITSPAGRHAGVVRHAMFDSEDLNWREQRRCCSATQRVPTANDQLSANTSAQKGLTAGLGRMSTRGEMFPKAHV